MPQLVDVEGIGQLEFPDDARDEEISAFLNREFPVTKPTTPSLARPTLSLRSAFPEPPGMIPASLSGPRGFDALATPLPKPEVPDIYATEPIFAREAGALQAAATPPRPRGGPKDIEDIVAEFSPLKVVPFVSSGPEIKKAIDIYSAAKAIEAGADTEEDRKLVLDFNEDRKRDTTLGYKVANILIQLPAFAGELWATGGTYTAGKQVAERAALRAAERVLAGAAEKAAVKVAAKVAGAAAGGAAQTPAAGALRIATGAIERATPQVDAAYDPDGNVVIRGTRAGEPWAQAVPRAYVDQFVETFTEHTGAGITGALGDAARKLQLNRIPVPAKVAAFTDAARKWLTVNPGSDIGQMLAKLKDRAQWHGWVGEIGEERLGEIMRPLLGTEEGYRPYGMNLQALTKDELRKGWEQAMAEGIAFAIPGVAAKGLSALGTTQRPDTTPRTDVDVPGTIDLSAIPITPVSELSAMSQAAIREEQAKRPNVPAGPAIRPDVASFRKVLAELGMTEAQYRALSEAPDVVPMPEAFAGNAIFARSAIEGTGAFAGKAFAIGDTVGPAFIDRRRTPLGRYINHSASPNVTAVPVEGGIQFKAMRPIIAGEELTADYAQAEKIKAESLAAPRKPEVLPPLEVRGSLETGLPHKQAEPGSTPGPATIPETRDEQAARVRKEVAEQERAKAQEAVAKLPEPLVSEIEQLKTDIKATGLAYHNAPAGTAAHEAAATVLVSLEQKLRKLTGQPFQPEPPVAAPTELPTVPPAPAQEVKSEAPKAETATEQDTQAIYDRRRKNLVNFRDLLLREGKAESDYNVATTAHEKNAILERVLRGPTASRNTKDSYRAALRRFMEVERALEERLAVEKQVVKPYEAISQTAGTIQTQSEQSALAKGEQASPATTTGGVSGERPGDGRSAGVDVEQLRLDKTTSGVTSQTAAVKESLTPEPPFIAPTEAVQENVIGKRAVPGERISVRWERWTGDGTVESVADNGDMTVLVEADNQSGKFSRVGKTIVVPASVGRRLASVIEPEVKAAEQRTITLDDGRIINVRGHGANTYWHDPTITAGPGANAYLLASPEFRKVIERAEVKAEAAKDQYETELEQWKKDNLKSGPLSTEERVQLNEYRIQKESKPLSKLSQLLFDNLEAREKASEPPAAPATKVETKAETATETLSEIKPKMPERLSIKPRSDGMVTLQDVNGNRIGTFKTAEEAGRSAIELGHEIAPGSELKPSWMIPSSEEIAARDASQAAFERLGAAEKGAHDKSKRKGMTKAQIKRLEEYDKLYTAERETKARRMASKPKAKPAAQPEGTVRESKGEVVAEPSVGATTDIVDRLEAKKLRPGDVQVSILPGFDPATFRAVWNTAIDIAIQAIRAGRAISEAIDAALAHLRTKAGAGFDEDQTRRALQSEVKPTRVQGVDMGILRAVEHVQPVIDNIKATVFDASQPISEAHTNTAWELFERFTNPATKLAASQEAINTLKAQAAPALILAELYQYGEKLALTGDITLLENLIPSYQEFALVEAGAGATALGRALHALGVKRPLIKQLFLVEKARAEAAGRKMGVGPDLMLQLLDALSNANLTAEDVEALIEQVPIEAAGEDQGIEDIFQSIRDAIKQGRRVSVTSETQEQDLRKRIEAMFPLAGYRAFYTEKGADAFVRNVFQLLVGGERAPEGHVWTADRLLQSELTRILREAAKAMGIESKSDDKMSLYDQAVTVLGKGPLRRDKIALIDQRVRADIAERLAADLERAGDNEDAAESAQLRAEMLEAQWDEMVGMLSVAPLSGVMLRRMLMDQLKQSNKTLRDILDDRSSQRVLVERVVSELRRASSETAVGGHTPLELGPLRTALELELNRQIELQRARIEASRKRAAERATARNSPEAQAKRYVDQLERSQTEWIKPEQRATVAQAIAEFIRTEPPLAESLFVDPLTDVLVGLGAAEPTARRLATEVYRREINRWGSQRSRQMARAALSRNLRPLIDSLLSTPHRARNAEWRRQTAINWFLSNGLAREQAEVAAEMFDTQFATALANAQDKAARKVLEDEPATRLKEIITAIRAGVLDPAKEWMKVYAAKAGWRDVTPDQYRQLIELDDELANTKLSLPERALVVDRMDFIFRQMGLPPTLLTKLGTNFVVTFLTGFPTIAVNYLGPAMYMVRQNTLRMITNPAETGLIWKALIDASRNFLQEAKFSLTHDVYTFLHNEFQGANKVLKASWETGLKQLKSKNPVERSKGLANTVFGSQQYSMRVLNAADQANMMTVREAMLPVYSSEAMRVLGLGTAKLQMLSQALMALKTQAYQEAVSAGADHTKATAIADAVAMDGIEHWLADDAGLGSKAAADVMRSIELDAHSTVGRRGPAIPGGEKPLSEFDEGGLLSRAIFNPLMNMVSGMEGKAGFGPAIAVSIFGYLKVPFRSARFYSWASPIGLMNIGIHRWRTAQHLDNWWKQSLATEYQERQRLKEAISGTMALAVLTGLGYGLLGLSSGPGAGDDSGVFVTGNGPKSKQLRDAWTRQGFQPNSITLFIGNIPARIPLSRVGEPLAHLFWLLAARDDRAWREKEASASGKPLNEGPGESTLRAIGTYLSLTGQRGFLQQLTEIGKLGSQEGGQGKIVATKLAQTVSGTFTPYLGLQNSIDRMFAAPVDRSSVEAAVAAALPVLDLFGDMFRKRQVNRLGDPIYDQSWFAKAVGTGVPIAFRVAPDADNLKVYKLLLDKGAAVPEARRYALEEKYGPVSDSQFADYVSRSGRQIKARMLANMAELKSMTPVDFKKWMGKNAAEINQTAALASGVAVPSAVATASRTTRSRPSTRAASSSLFRAPRVRGASRIRRRSLMRQSRLRIPRLRRPRLSSRGRMVRIRRRMPVAAV